MYQLIIGYQLFQVLNTTDYTVEMSDHFLGKIPAFIDTVFW